VSELLLRRGRADDLAAVADIYNAGIAERVATFETRPRAADELDAWATDGQPFIVAEQDGRVLGFARAGAYSDRCVYQGVDEHAVYVSPDARGRQLLEELSTEAERHGLYKLISRMFTDNHVSLAAHDASGFDRAGIQRRHGKLDGEWKDCVLVEKLIGEAARDSTVTPGLSRQPNDRPR
jgi:L-amino acid N-acyltransferase YncA